MHCQFGLNAKAFRSAGKRFHESPRHHAIASQHVGDLQPEHHHSEGGQKSIPKNVTRPIGATPGCNAPSRNDIEPVIHEFSNEQRRYRRIVRVVAVHQNVHVGLHIRKHATHHVAFA